MNAVAAPEGGQIQRIHEAYKEQLKADIAAAARDANSLAERVRSQWMEHPDTMGYVKELESALPHPNKVVKEACRDSRDSTEAAQLIALLKAISQFGEVVDSNIAEKSLAANGDEEPQNAAAEARKTAREIVRTTVRGLLFLWIDRRSTAARDYETVLLALTDDRDADRP